MNWVVRTLCLSPMWKTLCYNFITFADNLFAHFLNCFCNFSFFLKLEKSRYTLQKTSILIFVTIKQWQILQ